MHVDGALVFLCKRTVGALILARVSANIIKGHLRTFHAAHQKFQFLGGMRLEYKIEHNNPFLHSLIMPKVTGELFHAIKEKYGNVSSWALWATSENSKTKLGMDDISFFENPSDTLLDVLDR